MNAFRAPFVLVISSDLFLMILQGLFIFCLREIPLTFIFLVKVILVLMSVYIDRVSNF